MAYYDTYGDKYLASRPMRLHFAGWETDTYRLQQNGWQMSASQDARTRSVQLAFNHPEYRIRGMSDYVETSMDLIYGRDYQREIEARAYMASDFVNNSVRMRTDFREFMPIDAEPQFMHTNQLMSQHAVFAPNLMRTQEIIVPEHNVDDLLNMMLDKQANSRAALIRKRVREEARNEFHDRSHVHAQIISIAA